MHDELVFEHVRFSWPDSESEAQGEVQRSSRAYVTWLQQQLNGIESAGLSVDGRIGPLTREAIRAFQAKYAVAWPPDGVPSETLDAFLITFGAPPPPSGAAPSGGAPGCRSAAKAFPAASAADLAETRGFDGRRIQLHRLALASLQELIAAARAQGVATPLLLPSSGYRPVSVQQATWEKALKRYGSEQAARKWVCKPSPTCPHLSGLAVDLWLGSGASSANVTKQRATAAYQWMLANAHRFRFTNYCPEPWHWEFNLP
jgi:peptidoglycan hydrolase-like protein with peptidoglycan-binding domain